MSTDDYKPQVAAPNTRANDVRASMSQLSVIHVEAGHEEPEGEDHVQIAPHPAGGFQFSGTVGIHAKDVEPGSHTAIGGAIGANGPFQTIEAAEGAGIEWAAEQGAETLYVLRVEMPGAAD